MEAVGRAYVNYRSDCVAIVITQNGRVLRAYRDVRRFPFITVPANSPVPKQSLLMRKTHQRGKPSDIDETDAGVWIDVERGRRAPTLYEQVYVQAQGFATMMLSLETPEEDDFDPDSEKTAKERYRDRQARRVG